MNDSGSLKTSILIIGHPDSTQVEFGADIAKSFKEAEALQSKSSYAVIVSPDALDNQSCVESLKAMREKSPHTQFILIASGTTTIDLQTLVNTIGLFKTIDSFSKGPLLLAVQEALEEYELVKQNEAFFKLRTDQNKKLLQLTHQLEERVEVRQNFLIESKDNLIRSTKKLEALHRALVAIQRSLHTQDMEKYLGDALRGALELAWTRIEFKKQTRDLFHHSGELEKNILATPLIKGKEVLGHIYFAHKNHQPFSAEEEDFLLQVSDAVGLTVDRLMAIERIEELKQEWDSTFDAITDPVSMVSKDYNLIRANKAFAHAAALSSSTIIGKKCYEVLFGSTGPCEGCRLGEKFQIKTRSSHFVISSQKIFYEGEKEAFAVFYHDTSEQEKIQRQILESAKMAEIGTIGSSIAHEINNPLGGILAFVQMIKGSLDPEDKNFEDIVEMEKAALKCKTIVENLLAFTRRSDSTGHKSANLGDIIKTTLNIIELQTKSLGIEIVKEVEDPELTLYLNSNQIGQVLLNILQNSVESLTERLNAGERNPPPEIKLRTRLVKSKLSIEIFDNGKGIKHEHLSRVFTPFFSTKNITKNSGLGLSVSYQIVKDHGGEMEISSQYGKSTTVAILLPVTNS